MSLDADVAIIGAGPAGAAAAIALAPAHRVVLIDRLAAPGDRIGETLPGAARRLLDALGAWPGFEAAGHSPCHARRSVWGAAEPVELDGFRDPDGPGWRLDRRAFEAGLRAEAQARGARLIAPAAARAATRDGSGWRVALAGAGTVTARAIVDAGGRGSRLLRAEGGRRVADDRLICAWTHLPLLREPAELTYVEAEAGGWWYSAPLPDGRRLLAFHTDADLETAATLTPAALVERAGRSATLRAEIADAGAPGPGPARICAAHGARLTAPAGPGRLAVGDAALAFDPLSSQGLFNALCTGLTGGRAAAAALAGDAAALPAYAARLDAIWTAYREHCRLYYGEERRWPDAPFWARRLSGVRQ
ncbi:MAG TPA: tryptophan 7-halogenase [Allosphingosinicella sp.]